MIINSTGNQEILYDFILDEIGHFKNPYRFKTEHQSCQVLDGMGPNTSTDNVLCQFSF